MITYFRFKEPVVPEVSLTEQAVLRPPTCGQHEGVEDFRFFRIEYGFECGCPEGGIWLPNHIDPSIVEGILNHIMKDDLAGWRLGEKEYKEYLEKLIYENPDL